jgi:hypothetical protein
MGRSLAVKNRAVQCQDHLPASATARATEWHGIFIINRALTGFGPDAAKFRRKKGRQELWKL